MRIIYNVEKNTASYINITLNNVFCSLFSILQEPNSLGTFCLYRLKSHGVGS